MRWVLSLAFLGTAILMADTPAHRAKPSAATKKSSGVVKKKAAGTVSAKPTIGRSSRSVKTGKLRSRAPRTPPPSYQLHPDPERYQQIQQALADRGYFKGAVNGTWGDDSTDALRKFQTDQKLPDDGKITALSLTALGLGPRHDGSTASTVPVQSPAPDLPAAIPPPQSTPPELLHR